MLAMLGAKAQSNDQLIANTLGQDVNVSTSFINKMIKTGLSLNCDPWDDNKPCTDLCDPWDDNSCINSSAMKATIAASPKMQESILKNTMKHFEQAITVGKGGKFLNKNLLSEAQKKYPGYKLKAMKFRFKMYLKHLRSVK